MSVSNGLGGTIPEEVAATEVEPQDNESRTEGGEHSPLTERQEDSQSARPATPTELTYQPRRRRGGGPRSAMGKGRSRLNAAKHGIFAMDLLLETERKQEFAKLVRGLRRDFLPKGTLEGVLVDKLASLIWRYKRIIVAEQREILIEEDINRRREAARERRASARILKAITGSEPICRSFRLALLTPQLGGLAEIRQDDWNSGLIQDTLTSLYGYIGTLVGNAHDMMIYADSIKELLKTGEQGTSELSRIENLKEQFQKALRRESGRISGLIDNFNEEEDETEKTTISREEALVPPRLDRWIRYTASLERDFDRTLSQLERLQRIRRGQPVLPPIKIETT